MRDSRAVVRDRQHDASASLGERDRDVVAPVLERVLEELGEDERERSRALPGHGHWLERRRHVLLRNEALDEHRAQSVHELSKIDVVLPMLGEHLVHRRDREDAVDRVLQRLARIDVIGTRLEPEQGGDRLQVVLDPVVDLLGEDATHDRSPVLEGDCRVVGDGLEQRLLVLGERRVAVADELADLPPLPAQRHPGRIRARAAFGPGDVPVLEHERRPGRME